MPPLSQDSSSPPTLSAAVSARAAQVLDPSSMLATLQTHPHLRILQNLAQDHGWGVWLVGGAVRDWLFTGVWPDDLDVLVLDPQGASGKFPVHVSHQLAQLTAQEISGGRLVVLDEPRGIYRVVVVSTEGYEDPVQSSDAHPMIDLAAALDNHGSTDLARRDLTVNAMALDLATGALHDPFSGLAHLQEMRIAMVSEANLVEDPLRMVRVFRVGAQLNAYGSVQFDPDTLQAVTTHRAKLSKSAPERITQEWMKFLTATPCFPALQAMADTGLLETIFPELTKTRQVPPNSHHHLPLFDHTLELVRQVERLFPTLPEDIQQRIAAPFHGGGVSRFAVVKLGCLLHDIGKPDTWEVLDSGRHTFYGHDKVGEEITHIIGKRLTWSRDLTKAVQHLVRWHLYPCQFGPDSSRKSIMRFFRRMGDWTPEILLLAMADRWSTLGPEITEEQVHQTINNHHWMLTQFLVEEATIHTPPLLTGHQVMELLNLQSGPQVGQAMKALQEAQDGGEITTAEEARHWLLQKHSLS